MNINDFEKEQVSGDRLEAIFARQRSLMDKYHHIEERNGLLETPDMPVNIHDRFGQARIKNFAWRAAEELGEALEAFRIHDHVAEHYDEEVADALHFLTELSILVNYTPENGMIEPEELERAQAFDKSMDKLNVLYRRASLESDCYTSSLYGYRTYENLTYATGRFIEGLALACNCLKNKPWKQSHMLTDEDKFYDRLGMAWKRFFDLLFIAGIDDDYITELYFGKSQVNKFRQGSGY